MLFHRMFLLADSPLQVSFLRNRSCKLSAELILTFLIEIGRDVQVINPWIALADQFAA